MTENIAKGAPTRDEEGWRVSSFTNGSGSCVQIKYVEQQAILVRDSKDLRHDSPVIDVSAASWASLLRGITSDA